jgi:RHS repeat-associated protein
MRLTGITSKDPGSNAIMDYSYTYDDADNITVKTTEHGTYNYTYDDLYRLTDATAPVAGNESFSYDSVGNRLSHHSPLTTEYSYNSNNELNEYGTTVVNYDSNGNTMKKTEGADVTDYSWDAENRLMKVEKDGAAAGVYYYDPFGRRLSKTVGGATTYFFYSDEGLAGEFNTQGQAIKTYGFVPNSTWTTDPVFMKVGTNYYFYHNDHLGTPQKMTAVNGAVVWSAKYEAFGKAKVDAGSTIENNLRFPGQYYDQETGELYNWNRYYGANIGRYIAMDMIIFDKFVNQYKYVENKPNTNKDITGLFGDGETYGIEMTPGIKGHSDFICGQFVFDYTIEDHRWWSQPHGPGMMRHFRILSDVLVDLRKDIQNCDHGEFESHMHQGQDWFSHMGAGVDPIEHMWRGYEPDNNPEAWERANIWTCEIVREWDFNCTSKCVS